jgi:twitching motility protein PilI
VTTVQAGPFSILLELEREAREKALSFPRAIEPELLFTGIGFGVDSKLLVMPLENVCEVISYPRITRIPRIREWVHGIAAVRGQVLPIVELSAAIGGPKSALKRKASILAVRYLGGMIGLLVDELLGSRRFVAGEQLDLKQDNRDWLSPYVEGAFMQQGTVWNVFSVAALEESGALSGVSQ